MELTTSEKIRIILKRRNMSVTTLAEKIDTTRQNLTNKLARDNFTETDLKDIAQALDCSFGSSFKFNDTGEEIQEVLLCFQKAGFQILNMVQ